MQESVSARSLDKGGARKGLPGVGQGETLGDACLDTSKLLQDLGDIVVGT